MSIWVGGVRGREAMERRAREREERLAANRAAAAEQAAAVAACEEARKQRWEVERERRLAIQAEGIRQAEARFISVKREPIPTEPPGSWEPCAPAPAVPLSIDAEGLREFMVGGRDESQHAPEGAREDVTIKVEL